MEHHEHLEAIMEHYDDALEELMGAQKYATTAKHCTDHERRHRYKVMAEQELEHEATIEKEGEDMAEEARHEMISAVWMHLKKHLHSWRKDIESELEAIT